jgi:cytochrome P450
VSALVLARDPAGGSEDGTADGLPGEELRPTVFLLVMAGFDTTGGAPVPAGRTEELRVRLSPALG